MRTARIQIQVLVNGKTAVSSPAVTVDDCPIGVQSLDLLLEYFKHAKQDLNTHLTDFFSEEVPAFSQGINNASWHALVEGVPACNPTYTLRGDPKPVTDVDPADVCSHPKCAELWKAAHAAEGGT